MQDIYYIGLDVHERTISYCVKDGSGTIHAEGTIPATRFDLDRLTSLLAATNRRNRRQFYEKTVWPPFGHRDQAGEVDPVLPMLPDRYRIWR